MEFVGVPVEAAPAVVFAVVRKDGILMLHQNDGAALRAMQPGLLLVAFVASTVTATIAAVTLARVLAIVAW